MGLLDLVANSPEHYVELALRLGTVSDVRTRIKTQLAARTDVLFQDPAAVAEHVRFFRVAVCED